MEYSDYLNKTIAILENTKFCVLATSNNDGIVSASQVCLVNDGLKAYFETDKSFEKIQNIEQNDNVAINCGAYYFKGKANIIGKPIDCENFINKLKVKCLYNYEHYANLPNEVLVEVNLTECKIWGIENIDGLEQEVVVCLDLVNKSFTKTVLDKM